MALVTSYRSNELPNELVHEILSYCPYTEIARGRLPMVNWQWYRWCTEIGTKVSCERNAELIQKCFNKIFTQYGHYSFCTDFFQEGIKKFSTELFGTTEGPGFIKSLPPFSKNFGIILADKIVQRVFDLGEEGLNAEKPENETDGEKEARFQDGYSQLYNIFIYNFQSPFASKKEVHGGGNVKWSAEQIESIKMDIFLPLGEQKKRVFSQGCIALVDKSLFQKAFGLVQQINHDLLRNTTLALMIDKSLKQGNLEFAEQLIPLITKDKKKLECEEKIEQFKGPQKQPSELV